MASFRVSEEMESAKSKRRACWERGGIEDFVLRGNDINSSGLVGNGNLWTLKERIVSHKEGRTRRVGEAYLKYITNNEQAREGKVLRTDLVATG